MPKANNGLDSVYTTTPRCRKADLSIITIVPPMIGYHVKVRSRTINTCNHQLYTIVEILNPLINC